MPTHKPRRARILQAAALAGSSALLVGGLAATASAAPAPTGSSAGAASATNGYAHKHGVMSTVSQLAKTRAYAAAHPQAAAATGPETLSYGGGIDGIGVQSGHSKVYLVFYGTQWGSSSTDGNGNLKFTGDSDGAAGAAQQMFKGIGTGNELWSATLTQWCDGPNVARGAVSCPSNANFIPYQSGGVLSGVWYDNSAASPGTASGHQLGQEAVNAAAHFGNTTAASNRYAYYVILSPHGTNPDSYQGQYCAWHDYNGDSTLSGGAVSSPYGDVAFSNQPYNMDSGSGCGVGFVNSPGTLDGYTITLGHEWMETMSDQNPAGGWTNNTGSSYQGQENGDECAWLSPGTAGGAANVSMGNGSYAEQAGWSNDTNTCAISHPIVSHGGSGGPGELISAQSGKCLDTNNQVFANGTKEQIWTCSGIAGQTWTLSGGKLTVDGGAYCLDAYNNGTANGTIVDLWSCNGGANQQWTINSNGTITGNQSGKCLDVTGKGTANGTQVELWTCNGGSNQKWSW